MKLLKFSNQKIKKVAPVRAGINQLSAKDTFLQGINTKKRGIKKAQYVSRKYKLAFNIFVIFVVIAGLCFFAYRGLFKSGKFNIVNVEITGAQKFVSFNDIKTLVDARVLNKNYFTINADDLEKTISANFLGAKTIKVERKFPDTVKVFVEERIPLAVVYTDTDSYLIDGSGFVLGAVQNDVLDLPKIKYEDAIKIGTFLEKDIVPISIEILKESEKEGLKISSMSFTPRYMELYTNNVKVYIGNEKNKKDAIQTLNALIKKISADGKILKKVDLRYDKVIVLYD
jgi:cell division septal protein FtsQ